MAARFKVIICRPDPKNKRALEFMKKVAYYSLDDQMLRKMLREENAVDWSTYFLIGGVSLSPLDESHVGLVNQTWKFGKNEDAVRMILNMLANFPSCCVLDAEAWAFIEDPLVQGSLV
ncbi:glycine N-acyltransferase-like [Cyclopterus lumpus]|uniref:glycine N-acyltransferase-like n=1 Tax=Cyclopterus lumpus TaxID=8103 RepID=UPI0014875DE8|nr:glycine N-acyltransferase-like [Cyclopterus lumpus]